MQSQTILTGFSGMDGRLGAGIRFMLLASGVFAILVPSWELRFAFAEFGWWTIFYGVIVVGAWAVGLTFVACAVAGVSNTWTFDDARLLVEQRSPLRRRFLSVHGPDIARTEVRVDTWTDGPDTFSVVLYLVSGERLCSMSYESRFVAESLEDTVRARLGVA